MYVLRDAHVLFGVAYIQYFHYIILSSRVHIDRNHNIILCIPRQYLYVWIQTLMSTKKKFQKHSFAICI